MAEDKPKWEYLITEKYSSNSTARLKIPGGWLYRIIQEFGVQTGSHFPDQGLVMNTIFVPEK